MQLITFWFFIRKMNRFFCGMGLPNLMLCIIAIVVAAIVVGDNYIFHVRRNSKLDNLVLQSGRLICILYYFLYLSV